VLFTPVPIRVTVSVPDDLHRAIQSARGGVLAGFSTDIPYSSILETLARAGVAYYATHPFPKESMDAAVASDEQKSRLLEQVAKAWQAHVDVSAFAQFEHQEELPFGFLIELMVGSLAPPPRKRRTLPKQTAKDTAAAGNAGQMSEGY
jgi:hypothetical protein